MAEKTPDPSAGHAMFGLNEPEPRQAATVQATPSPAAGTPQYVYVQGQPPGVQTGSSGSKFLIALVIILLIVSGFNLYLMSMGREATSKHSDELDLLTRRLDSSDARYAQLSAKFQVTTERLGLTQQELSRARSIAKDIRAQQQQSVQELN